MIIFETKHFLVRAFKETDSGDLAKILSDPEVMRFIGNGNFDFEKTSALAMINWFNKATSENSNTGVWAVVCKDTGSVVGNCHISPYQSSGAMEFGLALRRDYWGKGFGKEICYELTKYTEGKVGRLVATVHKQNLTSKKLLASLGYKYEAEVIHYGIAQELYSR